jgi:hypothetical protein
MSPPDFARASRRMENKMPPLQYRLCHLPQFDTTRFYRAATGALAPSSIGDSHCREIGGTRAKRLRAQPRADAHLCELSAPRFDLCARGKPGSGRRVHRSRNHRVRPPPGAHREVCHPGMHRRIRLGCRRIAQGTAGNDALGFCRSAASRRGYAREGQSGQGRQRDHCGWYHLGHRFCVQCRR